jgi:hypothetical protein
VVFLFGFRGLLASRGFSKWSKMGPVMLVSITLAAFSFSAQHYGFVEDDQGRISDEKVRRIGVYWVISRHVVHDTRTGKAILYLYQLSQRLTKSQLSIKISNRCGFCEKKSAKPNHESYLE